MALYYNHNQQFIYAPSEKLLPETNGNGYRNLQLDNRQKVRDLRKPKPKLKEMKRV